jgi:hypothetical protein
LYVALFGGAVIVQVLYSNVKKPYNWLGNNFETFSGMTSHALSSFVYLNHATFISASLQKHGGQDQMMWMQLPGFPS